MKNAYFAGGCFWCISYVFESLKGVKDVISGFSGGSEVDPSYEEVKSQNTQHRETIKIIYDENIISLDTLIDLYFEYVDVLDDGGQGIDRGHSYSLALYYQNEEEKNLFVKKALAVQEKLGTCAHVTIAPFKFFILAEEEHQHFSLKNPEAFEEELKASNRLDHLAAKQK